MKLGNNRWHLERLAPSPTTNQLFEPLIDFLAFLVQKL